MKSLLFLGLVIIIAYIVWKAEGTEGFQDSGAGAGDAPPPGSAPGLNIPLISPRYQTLTAAAVQPFAPPSTALLAPPPGQMASVISLPAEDPAMEKAPAGRIQSVFESLTGFFQREAPGLMKIGDPAVQLPLSTAKGDKVRLSDELDVLRRNPGLPSSLTIEDMNGIEANLAYLQRKWRNSVNAMSGGPMPPEGFTCGPAGGRTRSGGWFSWFFGGSEEGFQSSSSSGSTAQQKSDVKQKDLQDLKLKIGVEIVRLQSSGTTDLNTTARISKLQAIQQAVDDLIKAVASGQMKEEDIPVRMEDINTFLPAMANPTTPLPGILKETGGSSSLNSLFPLYTAGDISGSEIARELFDKYAETFLRNLSWSITLDYKGKAEQNIAKDYAQAMADAKFISEQGPSGKGAVPETPGPAEAAPGSGYRGLMDSVVQSLTNGTGVTGKVGVGGGGPKGTGKGGAGAGRTPTPTPPAPFDWKVRANQICGAVRKRGLDPNDYGCLVNEDAVSENFSWRGYARMVCTRLGTNYDPSIPELCGCPPPTWPGWRS